MLAINPTGLTASNEKPIQSINLIPRMIAQNLILNLPLDHGLSMYLAINVPPWNLSPRYTSLTNSIKIKPPNTIKKKRRKKEKIWKSKMTEGNSHASKGTN